MVAWPGWLTVLNAPPRPRSAAGQHPGGQVAAVDVLERQVGRPGREHVAAALDPPQPPGHPADQLVRAEDEPGPGQQRPVAERLDGGQLAAALGRRVIVAGVAGRVAVHHRRALVGPGRERPLVHRPAGHVAVVARPAGQQPGRVEHHPRRAAPGVDDRVPGVVAQRRAELGRVGPVGVPFLGARGRRPADAPGQRGDLVTAGQRDLDDGPPDVMSSAQNQKFHPAIVPRAAGRRRACSSTA